MLKLSYITYLIASANPSFRLGTKSVGVLGTMPSSPRSMCPPSPCQQNNSILTRYSYNMSFTKFQGFWTQFNKMSVFLKLTSNEFRHIQLTLLNILMLNHYTAYPEDERLQLRPATRNSPASCPTASRRPSQQRSRGGPLRLN